MTFNLLGIDFIPIDNIYGFCVGELKSWENETVRSLIGIYYSDGEWFIDFFWIRLHG